MKYFWRNPWILLLDNHVLGERDVKEELHFLKVEDVIDRDLLLMEPKRSGARVIQKEIEAIKKIPTTMETKEDRLI